MIGMIETLHKTRSKDVVDSEAEGGREGKSTTHPQGEPWLRRFTKKALPILFAIKLCMLMLRHCCLSF